MQFWHTLGKEEMASINRDEYGFLHRRLSMALAPDLNEADAIEAAELDWREDTKGNESSTLTFEHYFASLLSLACMWTDDPENEEKVVVFLNKVYRAVTKEHGPMSATKELAHKQDMSVVLQGRKRAFLSPTEVQPLVEKTEGGRRKSGPRSLLAAADAAAAYDVELAARVRKAAAKATVASALASDGEHEGDGDGDGAGAPAPAPAGEAPEGGAPAAAAPSVGGATGEEEGEEDEEEGEDLAEWPAWASSRAKRLSIHGRRGSHRFIRPDDDADGDASGAATPKTPKTPRTPGGAADGPSKPSLSRSKSMGPGKLRWKGMSRVAPLAACVA